MAKGFANLSKADRIKAARKGGKTPKKKPTGFAAMTPERRRELGKKGGKRTQQKRNDDIMKEGWNNNRKQISSVTNRSK